MKVLSSFLLLALITLGGCSADDLVGPDSATDNFALSAQSSAADDARLDFAATPFSAAGVWEASDRLGTVTLFINETAVSPALSTARARVSIEGKGIVHDVLSLPVYVALQGHYTRFTIEIVLLSSSGETLAKGHGTFSTDRSTFKMELTYGNGSTRTLVFTR